jgi:hypothetical protein
MLGIYENFPDNVQMTTVFTSSVARNRLQRALTEAFHRLNTQNLPLESLGDPSIPQCEAIFELGIAEGQTFSLLDDEETKAVLRAIGEKTLPAMDFLCAIRYYRTSDGKTRPLRFDYYMLRFLFGKDMVELLIFHERGSMHVAPRELAAFLSNRINGLFSRRVLKAIETP